jgi:hypothetical protein
LINTQRLTNPADPLLAFGEALGIASDVWVKREELEQIAYTDYNFSQEMAKELTLDLITSLRDAYGDALTCSFRLGDLPVLVINLDTDNKSLEKFRGSIQDSPTIVFEFTLNKTRLVENWLGSVPGYRMFLYLFPNALESFLVSNLSRLESLLWGLELETAHKVVLLVPDHEIWLDGSYLAVLGGEQIEHLPDVVSKPPHDADELRNMYKTCQKNLNWQSPWLKHLTPLHLKVDGQIPRDDSIAKVLLVHQINSIILYTADRTVGDNNKPSSSTYAGANQSVELTLRNPAYPIDEKILAGVRDLMEMLEWAYNPKWSDDRLPLVQIGVVQALHAASPLVRYQLLLHNAPNIFNGLKWHWKAFIEGKVDNYVSQIQALEDYVANTVQVFADKITDMIKSLSDTMLAAVGVLIGSFIAALFKDKFDPNIFAIGMGVYALYVLIFPLFYNMKHQWEQYQVLCDSFKERQIRFEERLYPEKVSEIVGAQITDSQGRFKRWFYATFVAYIIVILLAIVAALLVPEFIEKTTL